MNTGRPPIEYDNPLNDITPEAAQAATTLEHWGQDVSPDGKWILMGVCSRDHATQNRNMALKLMEIAKGAGAYDTNPLKHADNCITDMKGLARQALLDAGYRRCDIPACNCGGWH